MYRACSSTHGRVCLPPTASDAGGGSWIVQEFLTALRVVLGTLLLATNTVVHVPFLMAAALFKALMPWT